MSRGYEVRQARRADMADMVSLLRQLFSIEQDFQPDPAKQRRGLELLLDSSQAHLFVIEQAGRVIGMLTVQILISTAEGGAVGLVEDVVVEQAHRGEGIGRAMLEHLRRWSAEVGLKRLQLLADRNNIPALEFYRKNGWNRTELIGLRQAVE